MQLREDLAAVGGACCASCGVLLLLLLTPNIGVDTAESEIFKFI